MLVLYPVVAGSAEENFAIGSIIVETTSFKLGIIISVRKPEYPPLTQWSIDHPKLMIVLSLILIVVTSTGVSRLSFSNDLEIFFSEDNPQLKAFHELEDQYAETHSVFFIVIPRDENVFTKSTLASVLRLTEEAWKIPYARRVDSLSNFQYSSARGDDLVVENLVDEIERLTEQGIHHIRERALNEPLLVNRLISQRGHVTGVNVPIQLPGLDPLVENPKVANSARQLAQKIMAENPNLDIKLSGLIMIENAFSESGIHDMTTLVPAMFVLILILLSLLLKTIFCTVATLIVIVGSFGTAMGLAGWTGIVLSPPTISATNIIMTLAIADSVHIIVTFHQQMRKGIPKREAILESLRLNYQPIWITSLTTMLGFLTLNASDSPPFRDLGNIVAVGVLFAWLLASYLLPALVMVFPISVPPPGASSGARAMEWIANLTIRRRKPLTLCVGCIILLLAIFIPRNELTDEYVKYFDESVPFREATEFLVQNLTGFEYMEYDMRSGEPEGISNPRYLKTLDAFAHWYREQPEVIHVNSFTDIMKRLNKNMNSDHPEYYRLPESKELAAQYLLLYEMSLPFGLDLNDQISIDKSSTRLFIRLKSIRSSGMIDLEKRAKRWLKENAPPEMQSTASGQSLVFAHIGTRNIRGMLTSSVVALIFISLLFIVIFKSIKFGLLSLIPNLAPAAMAYGWWGLTVGRVGLALSVVVGMTIGIVVDDTVHFMSKYLRARREQGLSPQQAIRYVFSSVGTAIWVTSFILVAGFSVLTFSDFEINSGMGLLCAITIVFALVADTLLLPPLLLLIDGE